MGMGNQVRKNRKAGGINKTEEQEDIDSYEIVQKRFSDLEE